MTPEEIDLLIARTAEGTLTPEEARDLVELCNRDRTILDKLTANVVTERLLHAVERDPDGRIAARELTLRLEQERLASISDTTFVPRVLENARRRTWNARLAIAAAVIAITAGAAFFIQRQRTPSPPEVFATDGPPTQRVPATAPVALLKRAVDVRWSEPSAAPGIGTMLESGWLRFQSGTVQLEFLSGARLIVAGPAELRLDSDNSALLKSGRATASVPRPARGFTLRTAGMDIVDQGTSFGVSAAGDDAAEVHVFDGAVSIRRANHAPMDVAAGRAVALRKGALEKIELASANFPSGEELATRAETAGQQRFKAWQSAVEGLAADKAALLTYTFEIDNEWDRTVTNQGLQAVTESHGAVVGAGWTTGRWPSKRALEFRSLGDRLRFTVPGRYDEITLLAWVRVDSLPNDYNSLILPTRYEPGALHWTLERGGELRLTMLANPNHPRTNPSFDGPVSGPAISSKDFGRWLFVATTYDSKSGTVTHYRDGRVVGQGKFRKRLPAVLGPVEFGNWGADASTPDNAWVTRQPPNYKIRNFVGRVDELAVLARVMTPAEIAAQYEIGRP